MIVFRLPEETAHAEDLWLMRGTDENGHSVERLWLGGDLAWMEAHWSKAIGGELHSCTTLQHLIQTQEALRVLPVVANQERTRPAWDPQEDRFFVCQTQSTAGAFRIQAQSLGEALISLASHDSEHEIIFCIEENAFDQKIEQMRAALEHPQWRGIDADLRNAHQPQVEIERVSTMIEVQAA